MAKDFSSSKNGSVGLLVRLSVCLSVHLSACYICFAMFLSSIIIKFSEIITIDRNDVHAKGQGQRSEVQATEVKQMLPQFGRFRTNSRLNSQMATKLCTKLEVS